MWSGRNNLSGSDYFSSSCYLQLKEIKGAYEEIKRINQKTENMRCGT